MPSEHTQDHSALQADQRDLEAKIFAALLPKVEEAVRGIAADELRRDQAQSPIEEAVLISLDAVALLFDDRIETSAQVSCGPYTLDLVVGYSDAESDFRRVVVECDGHEFHHATKEQVARDKARDRYVGSHYGQVLRFSGSEIYRDLASVIDEIVSAVDAVYWRDRPL